MKDLLSPTYLFKSILDIEYKKINKKILFFDLDNTVIDYNTVFPTDDYIKLFENLYNEGYLIYLLSNNHLKRFNEVKNRLKYIKFIYHSFKPFKFKIESLIKKDNLNKNEIVFIGDQIITDIVCANKIGITSILVSPINKSSERIHTLFNRLLESILLNVIKKNDIDKYNKIEKIIRKDY